MGTTSFDFHGRTAVVTGGAQGIGLALVRRLVHAGARVAIWDCGTLENAADVLGDGVAAFDIDVTRHDAVSAAAGAVMDRFGSVDILINSAGIAGPNAPVWKYSVEDWQRVVEIDLVGTFITCRACVPYMLRGGWGRIVNIASIAGKEGNPNASAYSAAKAGVLALTKSLGKELAGTDIRVNAVTPAAVRTAARRVEPCR